VHQIHQTLQVLEGRLWQDAVAEVEHVAVAPRCAFETSTAPPSTASHDAVQIAGSRLPWIARSAPMRSRARSSGTRQSIPIASPPASRMSVSSSPVPTPKWIDGTGRSSSTRSTQGCTERA
jgi:hypothetical protein